MHDTFLNSWIIFLLSIIKIMYLMLQFILIVIPLMLYYYLHFIIIITFVEEISVEIGKIQKNAEELHILYFLIHLFII